MVTSRRLVKTKRDRFGGFADQNLERDYNDSYSLARDYDDYDEDSMGANTLTLTRDFEEVEEYRNEFDTKSESTYEDIDMNSLDEDLRPSEKTLKIAKKHHLDIKNVKKSDASTFESTKLSKRSKILVVCYCLVAIAMIILIAVNATALGSISSNNERLTSRYEVLANEYAVLVDEFDSLLNEEALKDTAINEWGMTDQKPTEVEFEVPQMGNSTAESYDSNWFDKFLNLFG